jgi:hypothetical protein
MMPAVLRGTFCVHLAVCAFSSSGVGSGQPPSTDPLRPLAFLIGAWEGRSDGQPGHGTGRRQYARVLNSRFIRVENRTVYPPQANNARGETHEDYGMISFDTARQRAVLRQFHVEGFVNQYVAALDASPDRIVFTSEAIENIPAGWRARETYAPVSDDEVEETFELAAPGQDFELYTRTRLRRVR